MEIKIDWLKVSGIACTVLGAILSVASGIIDQKQTQVEIAKQVEEQVKAYMERTV